jgi:4-diphosphocytidyl-2-C-methyl-D-erythritol kinase
VFVHGQAAWAEGVGEKLSPLDPPECVYLVVRPDAVVSTVEVFQAPDLTRDTPTIRIRDFLMAGGRNDCEPVVRQRVPAVAEALDWLGRFAPARLTGTGSCVFAAMPDERAAHAVLERLPQRWTGWVVHGLNRSPLIARRGLEQDRVGRGR